MPRRPNTPGLLPETQVRNLATLLDLQILSAAHIRRMSTLIQDPSSGQPRNNGQYSHRTKAPAAVTLAGPPPEAGQPSPLVAIAETAVAAGMDREQARSYVGLQLVADLGQKHANAARTLLQARLEVAAAQYAISMQTFLSLSQNLHAAENMPARREAVRGAENRLRSLGGILEMANGRPIQAFEDVRGVLADLRPLYEDETAPAFAGPAETTGSTAATTPTTPN